jgi:nucleotide-binding universal stress UspA family protein
MASAMARRALAFVAGLVRPADGRVILLTAVDEIVVPSLGLLPATATVARGAKRTNARRARAAKTALNRAAVLLQRAGWRTRKVLTSGEPLSDLLGTVASTRAQWLVVGARGTSGVRHLLLGSVAEGAVNRSPIPVLLVR